MATLAQVAGVEIGGKLGADEIAQMFDPVDVGDCRGDEVTCHLGSLCFALWAVFSSRWRGVLQVSNFASQNPTEAGDQSPAPPGIFLERKRIRICRGCGPRGGRW